MASKYRRIIAVGDIHGMGDRFDSLYRKMDYRPEEDFLIFLGDYIDRGPDSVRMLDWMMEHTRSDDVVALRGNHEQMMIDFMDEGGSQYAWLLNSGLSTLQALRKSFRWHKYIDFVRSLPCSYQLEAGGKTYFFAHAGVNPQKPLSEQSDDDLLWVREEYYKHYQGEAVVVSGHTPVQLITEGETVPISKENMIMLDTGSFIRDGGHISAIDVQTREFWQSD